MANVMREVADLLSQDQNNQLFLGTISSVSSTGATLSRKGSTVVEGPYPTLTEVGVLDTVMVARVGQGYAVVGVLAKHVPVTYVTSVATYTVLDSDYIIIVDRASAVTVNLPTAVGRNRRVFYIKQVGAGAVTIDPNGAETIDGQATLVTKRYNCYQVVAEDAAISGGTTRWHII